MMTLTTIVIAVAVALALLLVTLVAPNPFTAVMALVVAALTYFVLWPKYEGGRQAQANGVEIQAAVQEVRHWNTGSHNQQGDKYEIIAVAPNPVSGKMQQFVSPPMTTDPQPYLSATVKVKVDWNHPKAYIMDVSFLPFRVN
ncbi:hypothetical protein [Neisseria perflava]|uniref:hypothetical protein n=1 Tax=Neisseria perflava TaxID=33053 RepID=UPI00209E2E18|nr:hypothetical protein [Neisseria perflava]MCP1660053.1 hypothetical protein [Neisseria perflava]MCP1773424.1 hypothetical protein [Neisseria perflava]